jgi:hypothetical protein
MRPDIRYLIYDPYSQHRAVYRYNMKRKDALSIYNLFKEHGFKMKLQKQNYSPEGLLLGAYKTN